MLGVYGEDVISLTVSLPHVEKKTRHFTEIEIVAKFEKKKKCLRYGGHGQQLSVIFGVKLRKVLNSKRSIKITLEL